jgi:hypothetical protein
MPLWLDGLESLIVSFDDGGGILQLGTGARK